MGLNWNEIKSRALLFSKTWADACNEDSLAKPFWFDFFEIFGITNKRVATFELNVKKLGGAQGFVDLFWHGVLLVEHKSRGKCLDDAVDQAIGYLPVNLAPIANLHHKDAQSAVLNVANHPAIAHPVAPESSVRPDQCLARVAWIFHYGNALVHEVNNAARHLFFELAQLTFGRVGVFNCPGQGLVSHRQRNGPVLSLDGHAQAHRQRGNSLPFLGYRFR